MYDNDYTMLRTSFFFTSVTFATSSTTCIFHKKIFVSTLIGRYRFWTILQWLMSTRTKEIYIYYVPNAILQSMRSDRFRTSVSMKSIVKNKNKNAKNNLWSLQILMFALTIFWKKIFINNYNHMYKNLTILMYTIIFWRLIWVEYSDIKMSR